MFHTGEDCAACQPLLFPTVGTSLSLVQERQTNNFVQVFFTGKILQSPLLVVTIIFLLGP